MVLLIDNYDSFSYNLYQTISKFEPDVNVVRNDDMSISEIYAADPKHIILSPGPGRTENPVNMIEIIREFGPKIPILGLCLGHQAVCAAYGGEIIYAKNLSESKQSSVRLDITSPLFAGLPEQFTVQRYHSLAVNPWTLPDCLKVIAKTIDGEIMGVAHREQKVYGLQIHPQSILSPRGTQIIGNFIQEAADSAASQPQVV